MSEVYIDKMYDTVKDFKCRTKDLKTLNCTFKRPSTNQVIKYRLFYDENDGEVIKNSLKNWLDGFSYGCI